MAKKKEVELYLVFDKEGEYKDQFDTFSEAQDYIDENELNYGRILKVCEAWRCVYPEEPEMDVFPVDLADAFKSW